MKKTHEHHKQWRRQAEIQNTNSEIIRKLKWVSHFLYLKPQSQNLYLKPQKAKSLQEFLTKMGFFTPSLMNHLCLNAFSRRPRLSTLLCSLYQVSLSLSPILFHSFLRWTFWDIVIFLVFVTAEVLGFVWFQFLCAWP